SGLAQAAHQRQRIARRVELVGVVEIDKDVARPRPGRRSGEGAVAHRLARAPGANAARPALEPGAAGAAAIELARTVQPAVDEVRGEIHQQWPVDGVGADQGNVVPAQECDEVRIAKALVTNLERMAQPARTIDAQPGARLQAMVMPPTARGG